FQQGRAGTVIQSLDVTATNFNRFAGAGLPANYFRNYPQFTQVIQSNNNGRSYYDSLQISVRRTSGALQLAANYTWSKSMDNISLEGNGFTAAAASGSAASIGAVLDNWNLRLNRALSDFDRPHSLSVSAFYSVPFGARKRWGTNIPRLVDTAIGGWQVGALQIVTAGQPFSVYSQRLTFPVTGVPSTGTYAQYNGTDRSIGSVDKRGDGVYFFTPTQVSQFGFPGAFEIGNA